MPKIIDYKRVQEVPSVFDKEVKKEIKNGFQPYLNPIPCEVNGQIYIFQAMVKYDVSI